MSSEEGTFIVVASVGFIQAAIYMEDMSDVLTVLRTINMILTFNILQLQFPV